MKRKIVAKVSIICILSIILSSIFCYAANHSVSYIINYPNIRAQLVDSYIVDYVDSQGQASPVGTYCVATYEFYQSFSVNMGSPDGYLYGANNFQFAVGYNNIPNYCTISSTEIEYIPYNISTIYSSLTGNSNSTVPNSGRIRVVYLNHFPQNVSYTLGMLKYKVSLYWSTYDNVDPLSYISCSCSMTSGSTGSLSLFPEQNQEMGTLMDTIIQSIDNSNLFNDVYSVMGLLQDIKDQDLYSYSNIVQYLSDNNDWLSAINTTLESIDWSASNAYSYLTWIYNLINDMRPYIINTYNEVVLIERKVNDIYNVLNSTQVQNAAESANNVANVVESQAVAVGNVQKPNVGNFTGQINNNITPSVSGQMQLFLAFINRPIFVLILTLVISLAFVGYLMYGKGV